MPAVTHDRDDASGALVVDSLGQTCLAVHPGYSAAPAVYTRVLTCRIAVCVLSCATVVLAAVGQALPYIYLGWTKSTPYYSFFIGQKISTWSVQNDIERYGDHSTRFFESNAAMQATALLAAIFALASLVLSVVLACAWCRMERARRAEEADNLSLQQRYQVGGEDDDEHEMPRMGGASSLTAGRVEQVPLEAREKKRRLTDLVLAVVTFALLIVAAIFALVTMALMARDLSSSRRAVAAYSGVPDGGEALWLAKVRAGLPLFAVCVAVAMAAFVVVVIPSLTHVHLCCAPAVPRCALVVVKPSGNRNPHAAAKTDGIAMLREDKAVQTGYWVG